MTKCTATSGDINDCTVFTDNNLLQTASVAAECILKDESDVDGLLTELPGGVIISSVAVSMTTGTTTTSSASSSTVVSVPTPSSTADTDTYADLTFSEGLSAADDTVATPVSTTTATTYAPSSRCRVKN